MASTAPSESAPAPQPANPTVVGKRLAKGKVKRSRVIG